MATAQRGAHGRDEAARVGRCQRSRQRWWWWPNRTCNESSSGAPAERDRAVLWWPHPTAAWLRQGHRRSASAALGAGPAGRAAERALWNATDLGDWGGGEREIKGRCRTCHTEDGPHAGGVEQRLDQPLRRNGGCQRHPSRGAAAVATARHGSGCGMSPLNRFRPSIICGAWSGLGSGDVAHGWRGLAARGQALAVCVRPTASRYRGVGRGGVGCGLPGCRGQCHPRRPSLGLF